MQEEYVEWRVVRSGRGIECVEFTTETSDYWRALAAHEPDRLRKLIGEFAGEEADFSELYGELDPFAKSVTAGDREQAFVEMTLAGGTSIYNNGQHAICCMVQPSNTLGALVSLAVAASTPRAIRDPGVDGRLRCLTCSEATPLLGGCAQLGRASDPLLVERLGRLASEGCAVTVDIPLGIDIRSVQHTRLRRPDGCPVPEEWFVFSREMEPLKNGSRPRYQRLKLQIPEAEDLCISDLADVATEERIVSGSQIADLVQVAITLRVSSPGVITVDLRNPIEPQPAREDPYGCNDLHQRASKLWSAAGIA